MKQYKSFIVAVAALAVVSCADDKFQSYQTADPNAKHSADYAYLNELDDLKSYTNPKASSTFKLGGAMEASDFMKKEQYYALGVANFDEIVAGNAMKMGSCVNSNGVFDYAAVTSFVNAAVDAGLDVYGHTLAWHSQQPVKWLNKLIADKEIDLPDGVIEKFLHRITYTDGPFPFYPMGCEPPVVNGAIHFEPTGAWSQFFICDGGSNTLTPGNIRLKIDISSDKEVGGVQLEVRNGWTNPQVFTFAVPVEAGRKVYEFDMQDVTCEPAANYDIILKPQTADATLDVHSVEVFKLEKPTVEIEQEVTMKTYTDGPFPFYPMGCEPPVINGAIHFVPTGGWSQFFICDGGSNTLSPGNFRLKLDLTSDKEANGVQLELRNGWTNPQVFSFAVPVEAGRKVYEFDMQDVTCEPGANYDVILKPQTADATLDVHSVQVCKLIKANAIPLTPEEKKDTLTWAMDKWISGMMEACEGKVKAWDVVNEAISGGDPTKGQIDAEGVYKLQHADEENPDPDSFFWQDYLDDYDYVRTAVKLAREYGPEDIKLFINDYNLESNWDDNGKLKSLIKWIERWESDGVTKIDGIGTQMHISCYADEAVQNSKKNAIVNMLTLMENWCAAGTGRYARISELDMAYVSGFDADGKDITVKTPDMTEEQHHAMADLYQFVIEKYFEIIKPEHQWGICQWCLTDSPANSNWRPGLATGLWSENFYRKHTYAGFANGLAGK